MRLQRLSIGLYITITATAALIACGRWPFKRDMDSIPIKGDPIPGQPQNFDAQSFSVESYKDCAAFRDDLAANAAAQMDFNWKQYVYYSANNIVVSDGRANMPDQAGAPAANPASAVSPSSNVGTNVQVAGVDEADDIKLTDRALFIASNQLGMWPASSLPSSISIVALNPLAEMGKITLDGLVSSWSQTPLRMFAFEHYLAVLGVAFDKNSAGSFVGRQSFVIRTFDVADLKAPKLVKEIKLASQPVDYRLVGHHLVAVLNEQISGAGAIPYPQGGDDPNIGRDAYLARFSAESAFPDQDGKIGGMVCTRMTKIPRSGFGFGFQHVVSYDVLSGAMNAEVGIPGSSSSLYMTQNNIYVVGSPFSPQVWMSPTATSSNVGADADRVIIEKVHFDSDTGDLGASAVGDVVGHLKYFDTSWAFNEILKGDDAFLSVVTSTGDVRDETGHNGATNHLTILRERHKKLELVSSLDDFGRKEDVRSVRYVDDKAYVVTFERTDPLFTIDLSDLLHPHILGELQIPGFSMYLHPADAEQMIGIGFQTEASGEADVTRSFYEGLLVQLFDIHDAKAPKRTDFKILGKRGSYTDANQDHHAFYYDASAKTLAVPVVLFDDNPSDPPQTSTVPNQMVLHSTREFSGVIFYKIDGDHLMEVKRVSHFDQMGPTCKTNLRPLFWTNPIVANPEIRRVFKQGDKVYAVSNFAVTVVNAAGLDGDKTLEFDSRDCPPSNGGGGFE